MAILDPLNRPEPDRDERQDAKATHVEIRPARRVAHLAERSLACPSCGVPVAIASTVGWNEPLACAFCESVAPTSEYLQEQGWPPVSLIARIG